MASARFWIVLFLGLSLCFFAGCTDDAVTDQNVLVQVGDWRLYRNDIPLDVYEGKSIEDSTREVKLYIENWVRSALLYRYAEQQIGKDNPTVERRVADYRRALYTQSFESDYVRNNLDTSVNEVEMKDFYEANRDLFTQHLSSLSMKAGIQFLVMPEEWSPLTSLGRYLPADVDITFGNRRARTAEFIDNGVVYLLSFQEWKGAGELAPYEYVRSEVHSIILNRREVNLLRELEEGIVKEGQASGIVKYKN